jgi:hypothetical protein
MPIYLMPTSYANKKRNNKTHVRTPQVGDYVLIAEHRKSGTSKLQVKWKCPRRIACLESDYLFVVENLLTKKLEACMQRAWDSVRIRNSTSLRSWLRPPSTTTTSCTLYRRHWTRATMKKMFHEGLVAWRGFPVGEATWESYSFIDCGCSGDESEVLGVSRRYIHGAQDAKSLRVLMGNLYALLRMRTLSISYAECGKVENDKSRKRNDWLKMWLLCMSHSRIQMCETRSRWSV